MGYVSVTSFLTLGVYNLPLLMNKLGNVCNTDDHFGSIFFEYLKIKSFSVYW